MDAEMEKQFLKAYDEHSDALFRYGYFKVYDRELAKDFVQEAFTRTWTYLGEGKKIENLRAFLYKILHNVIVDHIRKKKAVSLDNMLEAGVQFEDEVGSILDTAETREVFAKLGELEENDRVVLEMRYVEDMSVGEISKTLGVSENLISVRMHRAIGKLRKIMEGKIK